MKQKNFFTLFLSAFLFALSTPISKFLLDKNDPVLLAALFYLGAALGLLPFFWKNFISELKGIKNEKSDFWRLPLSVLCGGILAPLSFLFGIKYANASTASLFLNFEVILTAFFAFIFFKEHLGKRFVLSTIVALAAGITLALPQTLEMQKGLLLVFTACVLWSLDNNLAATMRSISPETNTMVKGFVGGLVNLGLYLSSGTSAGPLSLKVLVGALIVGAISYGYSIVLYIRGARLMGAARSQMIFALNPFIAILLSWIFLKENVDSYFMISLFLMFAGAVILYTERHEHEHHHEAEEHIHEHSHDDDHHFHQHEKMKKGERHTHAHKHETLHHQHPHYPDIHHRHEHK